MPKDNDLNLEVINAAGGYALYTVALVNLAIDLRKGVDPSSSRQDVAKYAKELENGLARCCVDKKIPVDVGGADKISSFIQNGELMAEISDLLVRNHSRQQELVFLLACLVCGVLTGSVGGVYEATKPAQSQAIAIGDRLGVPNSTILKCFKTKSLTPLRQFFGCPHWFDSLEAKPGWLGFSVDLKKLYSIVGRWFKRKGSS
jgi:hypothetical protein